MVKNNPRKWSSAPQIGAQMVKRTAAKQPFGRRPRAAMREALLGRVLRAASPRFDQYLTSCLTGIFCHCAMQEELLDRVRLAVLPSF